MIELSLNRTNSVEIPVGSGINEILASPWFQRVWTIQEVAFSRKAVVLCGQSEISWENLKASLDLLNSAHHNPPIQQPLDFEPGLSMLTFSLKIT